MIRPYEVVYIFDSAAEEPQVEEQLQRLHALLQNDDNPEPSTTWRLVRSVDPPTLYFSPTRPRLRTSNTAEQWSST